MALKVTTVRKWQRKAATLDSKAQELLSEMIREMGVDNYVTDYADNITHATEDMMNHLNHMISLLKIKEEAL